MLQSSRKEIRSKFEVRAVEFAISTGNTLSYLTQRMHACVYAP